MLARPANLASKQATHYYAKDDYYRQGKSSKFSSRWFGKGAEVLGLKDEIDSQDFHQLLEGYAPNGKRLHAKPIDPEKHRAATDYTFNAPKGISVAALVQEDQRLIEAHDQAVCTALAILEERYTQARAWNPQTKLQDKVFTRNLAIAIYRHQTNRNQDPHLHSHCVAINTTQDGWKWKAVSNELAVQHQKLLGQIYQNELAYRVRQLGYEIEPKEHGQFELKDYPLETLNAFSTRRQEIESHIRQFGESESVRAYQRAALQTRTRKTVLSQEEQHTKWDAAIRQQHLQLPPVPEAHPISTTEAKAVVQEGIKHLAEHEGAFHREQLEQHILETTLGQCPFSDIEQAINQSPDLVPYGTKLTTRDLLDRFTKLEQLLGMDDAENQTGTTEQIGGTPETESSGDPSSTIGKRVAERLAATLPAHRFTRRSTEQIDRCLEWIATSEPATGIDLKAVARGVTAIHQRKSLRQAGDAIATALESIGEHLSQLEQLCQQLGATIGKYRDPIKTPKTEKPEPGSLQWKRTTLLLLYADRTLQRSRQSWIENERYWAERSPESGDVIVARKADSQVIAQGQFTESSWKLSQARVEEEDWQEFRQQIQREMQQANELQEQSVKLQGFELDD